VVTDPPYGINFLGKAWDNNTGDREVYEQCLRVLKPGGHLLAFSAARTYHHLAMTVETVGFEIRDQIMWIYGSGFPKSQDVGRQIQKSLGIKEKKTIQGGARPSDKMNTPYADEKEYETTVCTDTVAQQWSGWGTQLKPAHEPIVMARKPVIGSIRENVLEHGTGAINIDACRVSTTPDDVFGGGAKASSGVFVQGYENDGFATGSELGRFPANVIHDGSDEVTSLFPHSTSGARKSTHKLKGLDTGEQRAVFGDDAISGKYNVQPFTDAQADEGSAARFFYCPKVSSKERHIGHDKPPAMFGDVKGCYGPDGKRMAEGFDSRAKLETHDINVMGKTPMCLDCNKTFNGTNDHSKCDPTKKAFVEKRTATITGNNHPTVKPIELMKYLIKLVTPPNGHILDPFNGSGSTGCAAVELGFDYTGIELDPNYVEIATKRISHWESECKPKTTYNNLFEEK
jgi:site-specific DNA-methyltransferase (adenine-specific)